MEAIGCSAVRGAKERTRAFGFGGSYKNPEGEEILASSKIDEEKQG